MAGISKPAAYAAAIILLFSSALFPLGYTVETIDSKSFYLEDRVSSMVIAQKNQDTFFPAASTVKLIAIMVARENVREDAAVKIPNSAVRVEPTKAYLRKDEVYYAGDLLHAMAVKSANDAAMAIAVHVSGSEEEFVKKMNQWCIKNEIRNTRIFDSTGLSGKSVTTAKSLSRIFSIFIRNGENLKMLRLKQFTMKSLAGRTITLKNSNNLEKFRNESGGKLTGKTGFTKKAGYCFTGIVSYMGREYFISLMGAEMAWHDISVLMDYANEKYLTGSSRNRE